MHAPSPARARVFEAHRGGRLGEAESGYRALLALDPADAELLQGLGVLLLQAGRPAEALQPLTQLLERSPPAGAEVLFALACRRAGEFARGSAVIEAALDRYRTDAHAWAVAGSLRVLGGDPAGGETALRRALALQPRQREVQHYLGIALHRQQRWNEALAAYRVAAREEGGEPELHFNIALCLEQLGQLEAAAQAFAEVAGARPNRVDALARLANVQALRCDFAGEARSVAALDARLARPAALEADDGVEPFVLTFLPLGDEAAARALDAHVQKLRRSAAAMPSIPPTHTARPERRLRLGYLSPDFGEHAVGGLVRDLFASHDRGRVEVYGYSLRAQRGPTADTIRAGFDHFHELERAPTGAIAQRIAADGIQVLIDLAGYTLGARPEVLALRPAPVQLGYLGFIHDYGAGWIDALLLDAEVSPGHMLGRSRVRHLPGCMLPAPRRAASPVRAARSEFGLPEDGPLFASFNNSYKLDLALLTAWVEIGRRAPQATFAVYAPEPALRPLREAWRDLGGAEAALLAVPKLGADRHLARSACCDLFLDALRYQAGATAVAAVEAGLPVLTHVGRRPLARLGVSLNRFLELDPLVCPDVSAYVERAVALALAPGQLAELRERMAYVAERKGFFDPARVAAAIEDAACDEWSQYCRDQAPGRGAEAG